MRLSIEIDVLQALYDLQHAPTQPEPSEKDQCLPPDRLSHSESTSQSSEREPQVLKVRLPIQTIQTPPLESDFEQWPDSPCILRPSSLVSGSVVSEDVSRIPINSHIGLKFESDLFKGKAWFYVRGLETTPLDMFEGKKRRSHLVIQGKFKKTVRSDNLVTGQDFQRPAKNLPAAWLLDKIFALIGSILGSRLHIGKSSERPYVMGNILSLAQAICVTPEGQEPPALFPVVEDMSAVGIEELSNRRGHPVSSSVRKRILQSHHVRKKVKFQPGQTWTFHIWQHLVDFSQYELHLLTTWDLSRYLDGQPIQFMSKDLKSGKYLWNFEVWHKSLLEDAWKQHQQTELQISKDATT
eukprot:TRINITY_DN32189_c0_g2_i1.p1 TRINITY_DN32189_c0_g2~~TRINITY_DN32189_c0_g2_i1.p1  ORF type:complete len:353 (+),score=35.84 TRINITY_DN32189_c0_g2_i1:159-1217(+)